MKTLEKILKSKRMNDRRGIQKALRRIDTKVLALALYGLPEEETVHIFRNMTRLSQQAIDQEFTRIKGAGTSLNQEQAQDLLAELLENSTVDTYDTETGYPKELPGVDLSSCEKIINTFEEIASHVFEYGLGSLQGLEDKSEHTLFKKAMQILLDGWDPLLFEQMLENYKEKMLLKYETHLSMIIEGMKGLQMGHAPIAIKENMLSLAL